MALQSSHGSEGADLQGHLLRLAEAVDRAIVGATWALAQYDSSEAQRVVDGDRTIDTLRYALEEHAILLNGLHTSSGLATTSSGSQTMPSLLRNARRSWSQV